MKKVHNFTAGPCVLPQQAIDNAIEALKDFKGTGIPVISISHRTKDSAEEVVFGSKSSGAANDIERATEIARKMVAMFGMSEKYGMMALASVQSRYLDGGYGMNCAQETFAGVDAEVRAIIDRCHADAIRLLEENREKLDEIASYLLKKETITGGELKAILEGKDPALAENFGATADPVPVDTTDMEPPARHIHREDGVVPPPLPKGEETPEEPKE